MRTLTVRRRKTFVAYPSRVGVYIEDPHADGITINNTTCRFLDTLRNGEEKSFEIGENRAKVFITGKQISKLYGNDFYEIEESESDIYLSGKNRFDPIMGNPFRFDNNGSEAAALQRKKNGREGFAIYAVACYLCYIILFMTLLVFMFVPIVKTFSDDNLSITLTNRFEKTQAQGYDLAYVSGDVAVLILEDTKNASAYLLEEYTPERYLKLVMNNRRFPESEIVSNGGAPYIQYKLRYKDILGNINGYIYRCYAYKSEDSFWLIQFVVKEDTYDKYSSKINRWANSVEFD